MPHNTTRLWVGLAIVAITIPAVGTFYTRSASTSGATGNPIPAAGRIDLVSNQDSPDSGQARLKEPLRDYQAEVSAALARQGYDPSHRFGGEATDDDAFDDDPLDADTDAYDDASPRDVSGSSNGFVPGNPNLAYSTDGPVTTDAASASAGVAAGASNGVQTTNDGQVTANGDGATDAQTADANAVAQYDDYGQSGTMSDSDIYRLVVNNLSSERRDDFVRAYSAMSAEQRSGLLDSFRQQIQGGQ